MEKPLRKLALNQETLRHLTDPDEMFPIFPGFKHTDACTQTCASICFGTCPIGPG
jgi:hypothetical protein